MFEALFKYPLEVFERGELVFSPVAGLDEPLLLVVIGVLVAAGLAASLLVPHRMRALSPTRRAALGFLQGVFIAGVLALLARPALEIATLAPGANTVAVLLDVSESMGFEAGAGDATRLEAAAAAVNATLIPNLSRKSEIATFTFGRAATRRDLGSVVADEPRTRLLQSLNDVVASFRGTPLAAVVVVSDGADNGADGADLMRLRQAGVPVHAVGVGPRVLRGEVQVSDVRLPADAPPDSRVVAGLVIEHASDGPATVKVFDGARLVAAQELELRRSTPTQRLDVAFDSGPGGIRELAFEVDPPPGDSLAGNNRRERLLTVSERRRKVLYLEGEPRWEYKFIRRAVGGDDVLRLSSWVRTTERKTYRQGVEEADELQQGFPESREALYRYDVVVLGSLAATYLSDEQHQWLESFVAERGGSLLALAGREALADGGWDVTPVADVLPVRLLRMSPASYAPVEGSVRPTTQGLRSPVTHLVDGEGADPWGTLPPLGDHQRLGALKPAASTLLEVVIGGESLPLLVSQPYGLGNAAVLATSTTWRWRMRTPAEDDRHTLFWRQLLRQLGESAQQPRDLRFTAEDEVISVRLVERDEQFAPRRDVRAEVTITGPGADGDRLELTRAETSGMLVGHYRAPAAGTYRIDVRVAGDDEGVTRFVRVGAQRPEQFQPAQNRALLERIAQTTGGRYWSLAEIGGIPGALTLASSGVRRSERFPLWDMPAVFLLLFAVKSGEWLLRRRWRRI